MTRAGWLRRVLAWCGLALALCGGGARADTPVILSNSWVGNVNFTGTQVTMRKSGGGCSVADATEKLTASISNIPKDATILSAQLYWAGSNSQANANYTVTFQGQQVSAGAGRQYFSNTFGLGFDYFAGAADVTKIVKGNGKYTFSGLTVSNDNLYCWLQGVVGGFSLLVVYSERSEPFRVLNLYEGFQHFLFNGLTLGLGNFKVPPALPDTATARFGHITWHGDAGLQLLGEELSFNGTEMTDKKYSPAGNPFDSKSKINDDETSYGIDFDAFTISPKSGIFKAGDTAATTRYQAGLDLVLLNAEIVAMPTLPPADLGLELTRNGELRVGLDSSYTLRVSNAGPYEDKGPVTVTVTLPAGLTYKSGTGTGWSCTAVGQAITCKSDGPLNVGATLAPITLTVQPTAAAAYTTSAKVAGEGFDSLQGNNTASDSATASAAGAVAYVFTDKECKAGTPVAKAGEPGCHLFSGPVDAGSKVELYITAVAGTGSMPIALGETKGPLVTFRFSLTCTKPGSAAGKRAAYAEQTMPLCTEAGKVPAASNKALWSPEVTLLFPQGSPSARLQKPLSAPAPALFTYPDVGLVQLNLVDALDRVNSVEFVSKPASLAFSHIRRRRDGADNPADAGKTGFAKAGEEFSLGVVALLKDGLTRAPSFGREEEDPARKVWPAVALAATPNQTAPQEEAERRLLSGAFTDVLDGVVSGARFAWAEAGVVTLAPIMEDYLGKGPVAGAATMIGRFYPDHFDTAIEAPFSCPPRTACPSGTLPSGENVTVTHAVYSRQKFVVNVTPVGVQGNTLARYVDDVARPITLLAFDQPNGVGANPPGAPGKGELSNSTLDKVKASPARIEPTYKLPAGFNLADPRAAVTAPTPIYIRAMVNDVHVIPGHKTEPITISSQRANGKTAEGGVTVVNGRLQLSNAFGSELLKLPINMAAQYWTGAAWENNTADSGGPVNGDIVYSGCQKSLLEPGKFASKDLGADNCNLALLQRAPGAAPSLDKGVGKIWLQPPGRGNVGSAWFRLDDQNRAWLPSTWARAVFGIYKSPLIYIREVY